MTLHSYSSLYNLGHREVKDIFSSEVIIEEKIDGSQINFGVFDGKLTIKSKGSKIDIDDPNGMFKKAVENIIKIKDKLHQNCSYRGEYLQSPKHNVLKYNRVPENNIIIFDVEHENIGYYSYEHKKLHAEELGFECAPLLEKGIFKNHTELQELLNKESILGGCKIEGFVIKNYSLLNSEKKLLIAKYVSENFKEKNGMEGNKKEESFSDLLALSYKTDARWNKAIQHLRDENVLDNSPKDIGLLIKEINLDVLKEHKEEIKDELFKHYWTKISKTIASGFPEYYKKYLMEKENE